MRRGAPGIDKVTVQELCKVRVELLAILFTGALICGNLPKVWKKRRTVLIPKTGGDLRWATNWRPLMISSVFVQLALYFDMLIECCIPIKSISKGF